MPPKKQPIVESGGSRVTTRATNANKHPGTEAKKTLQVQNRRDPEVVKADKEKKRAAKEAKEEARQVEAAQRQDAQQNLDEFRARQAAGLEHDDEAFPQQQAKGRSILSSVMNLTSFNRWQKKYTLSQYGVSCCKQVCWRCR